MSSIPASSQGRFEQQRPGRGSSADRNGQARQLADELGHLPAARLLEVLISRTFPGRIALVSSFGAEAAVLLHMVSVLDAATPILFLDTGKLFGETLRYRDRLVARLGLRDLRTITPDADEVGAADPHGRLWQSDPDRCCFVRKVAPLQRALRGFDAWINGRKRYHGGSRASVDVIEADGPRIKVNPLSAWLPADIETYFSTHDLPRHPLVEDGYASIGCLPCSDRTAPGEDVRSGRWRGRGKTECGIHLPFNGTPASQQKE